MDFHYKDIQKVSLRKAWRKEAEQTINNILCLFCLIPISAFIKEPNQTVMPSLPVFSKSTFFFYFLASDSNQISYLQMICLRKASLNWSNKAADTNVSCAQCWYRFAPLFLCLYFDNFLPAGSGFWQSHGKVS